MDVFDQDEVDALNQAAQTARQKRAEHFRRRKVVSEVYDTVLKIDAGTQTVSYPCLHVHPEVHSSAQVNKLYPWTSEWGEGRE